MDQMIHYFRDLMIVAANAEQVPLQSLAEIRRPDLSPQAESWGLATIVAALQILVEAKGRMFRAVYARALAELALVRISLLEDLEDLAVLVRNLSSGGGTAADAGATAAPQQRRPADRNFKNLIEVVAVNKENRVSAAGVVFGKEQPRIIRVNDFGFDIQASGHILFYRNDDKPGMLASVGAILAEAGINIGALALGRREKGSTALTAVNLDDPASDQVISQISSLEGVHGIRKVQLD